MIRHANKVRGQDIDVILIDFYTRAVLLPIANPY